jgi:tetratricopeptide (TPR) repeat protein
MNYGIQVCRFFDEAIPIYKRALGQTPSDPLAHQNLGVAFLQQTDMQDAITEFRTGLSLNPNSYQLHYNLGLALKLKDDVNGAITELEQAAGLNPTSPDPPYTLGILYMQMGRFADSEQNLKTALNLRPDNGDGWPTLGSIYKQEQKFAEASDALYKAIELMPATRPAADARQHSGAGEQNGRSCHRKKKGRRPHSLGRQPAACHIRHQHRECLAEERRYCRGDRSVPGRDQRRSKFRRSAPAIRGCTSTASRSSEAAVEEKAARRLAKNTSRSVPANP